MPAPVTLTGDPDEVLGVCFSDPHFSLTPPPARSVEKDWLGVQAGYLLQVADLANQPQGRVPVIVAGDFFPAWNAPVELVNFLAEFLPVVHAVPGNHDLPGHNYNEKRRTAYWTLVKAGRVIDLEPYKTFSVGKLLLRGFPCGFPAEPCGGGNIDPFGLRVAVVHDYVWTKTTGYTGAAPESRAKVWRSRVEGYDTVVIGDNHSGFLVKGTPTLFNCGCFVRRRSVEESYRPTVGLIKGDGSVEPHFLDVSGDKFADPKKVFKAETLDSGEFVRELKALGDAAIDYAEAVRRRLTEEESPPGVRREALRAMGEKT